MTKRSTKPFSSEATVQIANYKMTNYEFEMYDVFGRVAKQFVTRNSSFVIERSGLPSGIYFYKVFDKEKVPGAGKVIIE